MKQSIVLCLTILFLVVSASGKSRKADLTGTWNRDKMLSDAAPTVKINSSGGTLNTINIVLGFFFGGADSGPGIIGPGRVPIGARSGQDIISSLLIGSAMQAFDRAIRNQRVRDNNPGMGAVPDGIIKPLGYKLIFQHTEDEIVITHAEAVTGKDYVETYRLGKKEQARLVETSIGKLKQVTKVRLGKDNLKIEIKNVIQGGTPFTKKM
jgi:hypothetical protein